MTFASGAEGGLLEVAEGAPLLMIRSRVCSEAGGLLAVTRQLYRTDRFRFAYGADVETEGVDGWGSLRARCGGGTSAVGQGVYRVCVPRLLPSPPPSPVLIKTWADTSSLSGPRCCSNAGSGSSSWPTWGRRRRTTPPRRRSSRRCAAARGSRWPGSRRRWRGWTAGRTGPASSARRPIPVERLEILPAVDLCMTCQSRLLTRTHHGAAGPP